MTRASTTRPAAVPDSVTAVNPIPAAASAWPIQAPEKLHLRTGRRQTQAAMASCGNRGPASRMDTRRLVIQPGAERLLNSQGRVLLGSRGPRPVGLPPGPQDCGSSCQASPGRPLPECLYRPENIRPHRRRGCIAVRQLAVRCPSPHPLRNVDRRCPGQPSVVHEVVCG